MFSERPKCRVESIHVAIIDPAALIKEMDFFAFTLWLSRPIYDIETRKLCSYNSNRKG